MDTVWKRNESEFFDEQGLGERVKEKKWINMQPRFNMLRWELSKQIIMINSHGQIVTNIEVCGL